MLHNAQNLCRIKQRNPSPIKLPIQHFGEHGHDGVEFALVAEQGGECFGLFHITILRGGFECLGKDAFGENLRVGGTGDLAESFIAL